MTQPIQPGDDWGEIVDDDEPGDADRPCPMCGGDGMEDDVMPCPHCDGEGYEWWL